MSKIRTAITIIVVIFFITSITLTYEQSNLIVNSSNNSKINNNQTDNKYTNNIQSNENYLFDISNFLLTNPHLDLILGAIIGFASAIGKDLLKSLIDAPRIKILNEISSSQFDYARYLPNTEPIDEFIGFRIQVENKGNTAAENCKATIIINNEEYRIAWLLRNADSTITLNAHDKEYVDVCAVSIRKDKWIRIFPTERGYGETQSDGREFANGLIKAIIKISSKNSKIVKRDVWFLPSPNSNHEMLSFNQP